MKVSSSTTKRAGRSAIVDLWCFFYEEATDARQLEAFDALLTPDERARCESLRLDRDRRMFLATRALARTVLSEYADVAPAEWRFGEGEHGKPFITGPLGVPTIQFNLTNTRSLVVCAVSTTCSQVGVDAECVDRPRSLLDMAADYLSPIELARLDSLPRSSRQVDFLRYWTLKESYVKARGLGLAVPLHELSFFLEEDRIRVAFDPRLNDDPRVWSFAQFSASPTHIVAVSAAARGNPLVLRLCHYQPLGGAVPPSSRSAGLVNYARS